jgi:hypothetical protein
MRSWNGTTCTSRAGEDDPAPAPVQDREGVAGEHAEDDRPEEHAAREDARVDQPLQQVDALVDGHVVVDREVRRAGECTGHRGIDPRLQRADDHVVEGEEEHEGAEREHDVEQRLAPTARGVRSPRAA